MNIIEPAQLDDVCPHPIVSKELLKWTSLDKLEQDFALFRKETSQLDTRIMTGSKFIKKLAEEKSRELADIFVISAGAGRTTKEIIDIRLSAYIRSLEFISREIKIMLGHNIWTRLLSILSKLSTIIYSFKHAEDTPDVRWFFKNRVIPYLVRESLIYHWTHYEYLESIVDFPIDSRLKFLEYCSLHIDEDDCHVIVEDVIFPQLELTQKQKYHICADCHDVQAKSKRYSFSETSCTYLSLVQSLANRHDSLLEKLIQFSMEQLLKVDQRDQAKRLLFILFRVAHDRQGWIVINATLARLLSIRTNAIGAFAIRLFKSLVEWNKSKDGTSFEILSEHFDSMIELLDSTSSYEIQDANHSTWRFLGRLGRLKPREYQSLRVVIDTYLRRMSVIPNSGLSEQELRRIRREFGTLCWLIMPKITDSTGKFDFNSASNQLSEDLQLMIQSEAISKSFYADLKSVCEVYKCSLMDDESRNQFDLIRDRASWLFIKRHSSGNSRDSWLSLVASAISGIRTEPGPVRMSLASYLIYCNLLTEIHQYFYNPTQILEPHRYLWLSRVITVVGPWQYSEEKLKAIESCLLKAIEIHPRWKSQFFNEAFPMPLLVSDAPKPLLHSAFRLAYHESRTGRNVSFARLSNMSSIETRSIQSRRMLLVSFCKYSITHFNHDYMPRMIDLLSELELAYEVRAKQGCHRRNFYLLPSCVELAFPTPFDNPNNPMYICEFAYFRDTMDYLRRNKSRELDRVFSQLSENESELLEYYQNKYNNHDVCCSMTGLDKARDRFRCIDHKISDPAEPQICPLLNRYQYCHSIKN